MQSGSGSPKRCMSRGIFAVIITVAVIALVGGYIVGVINCKSASSVEANTHWSYCPTPTPVPTPVPLWSLYSEWIPMPGTSVGWIRARDFSNVKAGLIELDKLPRLTDEEWRTIGDEHGLWGCCYWTEEGFGDGFGFSPVEGFPTPYGGAVLRDAWLPERLR